MTPAALFFALFSDGLLPSAPCRQFGRGKRLLFLCTERALIIAFPVTPPESCRAVLMGNVGAVLLVGVLEQLDQNLMGNVGAVLFV